MNLLTLINPENVTEQEASAFRMRNAARAIVYDADGKIALLHATIKGYYKLPGGGIEAGEDPRTALLRECREEIGCDVRIEREIGTIIEYRKRSNLNQVSTCFIAHVEGTKGTPELTDDEKKEGFQTVWLTRGEATRALESARDSSVYEAAYMSLRESAFLRASM